MNALDQLVDYKESSVTPLIVDRGKYGGLYEKIQLQMLRIKLSFLDSDIRICESNPTDIEDCIVYSTKKPTYTKVQIKSSTVFTTSESSKKLGKHGRINCWSFTMLEKDVKMYIDNGIEFFIFTTSVEKNVSYSGIDKHSKVTSFYSWIVPSQKVLHYWKNRAPKSDYSINIHDGKFEHDYFEKYQLILDHIYG